MSAALSVAWSPTIPTAGARAMKETAKKARHGFAERLHDLYAEAICRDDEWAPHAAEVLLALARTIHRNNARALGDLRSGARKAMRRTGMGDVVTPDPDDVVRRLLANDPSSGMSSLDEVDAKRELVVRLDMWREERKSLAWMAAAVTRVFAVVPSIRGLVSVSLNTPDDREAAAKLVRRAFNVQERTTGGHARLRVALLALGAERHKARVRIK